MRVPRLPDEVLEPTRASTAIGASTSARAAKAANRNDARRMRWHPLVDFRTNIGIFPAFYQGLVQDPAIVRLSTRTVGASVPRRNTRSLAGVRCENISNRLPAMVISATGSASLPSRMTNPAAPRL